MHFRWRSPAWISRIHSRNKIYGSDLLAPLAFAWLHSGLLRDSSINLYMGSNNCIASLTRGDTPGDFMGAMVAEFWRLCQLRSIDVWIGRVRSKLNIADIPTKKVKLPLRVGKTEFYHNLLPLLPQCVIFTQKQPFRRIDFPKSFLLGLFHPQSLALHAW